MTHKPIRVGFIGLNPGKQWAAFAHIPALKALPAEYEVVGVANTSLASAQNAANAFDLPYAFENPQALIQSPEIDLVVVTVKVQYHYELVKAALNAGKHVFCEWPLGLNLDEATELAELAKAKKLVTAIGTQLRTALEIDYLHELIAAGYIGEVLSTTLVASGDAWGHQTETANAYVNDRKNGATMLSVPVAHTIAGMIDVLGDFADISARMINRYSSARITQTGETIPKTAHDQVLIHGSLKSGAAFSIHYRGGISRGTNLLWEINGTDGDIQVTGASGHAQIVQLSIRGATGSVHELVPLNPPASAYENWPDNAAARNLARLYAKLARDIVSGTHTAPDFQDAVKLHRIIDAIENDAGLKKI